MRLLRDAYLMTFGDALGQNLAFSTQGRIALLGPHQPCMHIVQAMLEIRQTDITNILHRLCGCTRL